MQNLVQIQPSGQATAKLIMPQRSTHINAVYAIATSTVMEISVLLSDQTQDVCIAFCSSKR